MHAHLLKMPQPALDPVAKRCPRRGHAGGFTLLELMLSASILTIIGLAVASMSVAAADGWHFRQEQDTLMTLADRSAASVSMSVRSAEQVGYLVDGSSSEAQVSLWLADDLYMPSSNVFPEDRVMQYGELAMIRFDRSDGALLLRRRSDAGLLSLLLKTPLDESVFISATVNSLIQMLPNYEEVILVQPRAPARLTDVRMALEQPSSGTGQTLRIAMAITRDGQEISSVAYVALRGTLPGDQGGTGMTLQSLLGGIERVESEEE